DEPADAAPVPPPCFQAFIPAFDNKRASRTPAARGTNQGLCRITRNSPRHHKAPKNPITIVKTSNRPVRLPSTNTRNKHVPTEQAAAIHRLVQFSQSARNRSRKKRPAFQ